MTTVIFFWLSYWNHFSSLRDAKLITLQCWKILLFMPRNQNFTCAKLTFPVFILYRTHTFQSFPKVLNNVILMCYQFKFLLPLEQMIPWIMRRTLSPLNLRNQSQLILLKLLIQSMRLSRDFFRIKIFPQIAVIRLKTRHFWKKKIMCYWIESVIFIL